ncbi:MAG: low molecular weight protein-tyrosine-phosphatase [Candidatus Sedimenticola sp. 6PFRAG7]
MVRVLFVCMGNICRSPTAHGVFEALVEREGLSHIITVDSAGTHAYHVGEQPDPRSQSTARSRGFDLSYIRARKAEQSDFQKFDYVLAMDSDNYSNLKAICPQGLGDKLQMFLDFAPDLDVRDVPDPYYGGAGGFERVFDMVEAASEGLLADIRTHHL